MRKIIFFVIENSWDNPGKIFFQQNKNSLLDYRNKHFFFDSNYGPSEKIIVRYEHLVFDKTLYQKLVSIKDEAIKEAQKISMRKIGVEYKKGSLNGLIFSQVQKSYYEPPKSIFYFCAQLFIRILMAHKLFDGNKRVALCFLIVSLRYFGYHLDWSKGLKQNYKYYETKVERFVEKLEKGYNDNNILEIEKWIIKHTVIALEWR